jgi:heat shock protein HtpX
MKFEETNLFAQQAANRRKSRWIIACFITFFAWLGFGADFIYWMASRNGRARLPIQPGIPVVGVILTVVAVALVFYIKRHGAEKVLWATGARRVVEPQTDAERRFANVAEEMAIASGMPMPGLWIVDDPDPNAFATGDKPSDSHVAVTSGLLEKLNRDELQGVVGHELGHIKNLDTQLMTLLAALVGAVVLMRDGMARALFYGGAGHGRRRSRSRDSGGGQLAAVLIVLWIISWVLAPIVVNLLALWVSRKREYLADTMSAQFTRNPGALADALERIESADEPTRSIKSGVAHLCIADPLGRQSGLRRIGAAFATHPPMADRIARLRRMGLQHTTEEGA